MLQTAWFHVIANTCCLRVTVVSGVAQQDYLEPYLNIYVLLTPVTFDKDFNAIVSTEL